MTVDYLLKSGNVKDVATLIRKSKNVYELQEEVRNLDSFKILKEADRLFLMKHMLEACISKNLYDLDYCVARDPIASLNQIRNAT